MDGKGKLFGFIKILIAAYLIIGLIVFFNGSLVLDVSLNALKIVSIFVICSIGYGLFIRDKKYIVLGTIIAVAYIALAVACSPIISYKSHRNLIGNVEEVDFSSEIKYIDLNQLPTIDKELAEKLADKKLGEIASLGSQVEVGDLHIQSINDELYYVAPLEHSSFLKWFTNREGTQGYIKVSATNQNDVELVTELNGEPLNIKYLDSSYLFSDLRLASYLRDLKAGHTDYTFELDDDGKPYWVITRYDNAIGISEAKAIGVLVMDSQTGESHIYDVDNAPEWIDRIQPKSFVNRYINKWGELVHGVFNFTDKDKLTATDGINTIYNDNNCYYYTGVTSVGSDESLVGFTLTNTRTGETKLYKTSGATESASMKSAEGKVQQYGYTATFPYLINIQNEPTYFMTLKDSSGLVKQYAMVNVKNYNTVGVGDTLQGTLNKYLEGLTNTSISLEGGNKEEKITGQVDRIGVVIKDGTSIYDIKLKDNDNIFQVSTETARDVALTAVGDSVEMNFIKVGTSRYIIVNSFINNSLGNIEEQQKEQEENKQDNNGDVELLDEESDLNSHNN